MKNRILLLWALCFSLICVCRTYARPNPLPVKEVEKGKIVVAQRLDDAQNSDTSGGLEEPTIDDRELQRQRREALDANDFKKARQVRDQQRDIPTPDTGDTQGNEDNPRDSEDSRR